MMREVLERRFKRLINENPRATGYRGSGRRRDRAGDRNDRRRGLDDGPGDARRCPPWPDLVLIDGGQGQLNAARETLATLGVTDVPLVAVAKGVDRDAGRETFFMPDRRAVPAAAARSAALFRRAAARRGAPLRDRLAPRAAQARHPRSPACRKFRASARPASARCSMHFGTLKAIEHASLADLAKVPGISADSAQRIYDYFHDKASADLGRSRAALRRNRHGRISGTSPRWLTQNPQRCSLAP